MSAISLKFDRDESYCLLAAQEYLRQMISRLDPLLDGSPDDEGIPRIISIRMLDHSSSATSVVFGVESVDDAYTLEVTVAAGDLWPKEGFVHLKGFGMMELTTGVLRQDFELRGKPGQPEVVFTVMRGGG